MLADVTRGKKGSGIRGGQVSLLDVNTGRLTGLKYELVFSFKLVAYMIRSGGWEFTINS